MPRRKRRPTSSNERKQLDLHGMRHADVDAFVENYLLLNHGSTIEIITGNSAEMKRIVLSVIDRHGFKHHTLPWNSGMLIVY